MTVYHKQTRAAIKLFLRHRLTFASCIAALDAALAELPRLSGDQLVAVRALMLANNDIVMKEMERRGPQDDKVPTVRPRHGTVPKLALARSS